MEKVFRLAFAVVAAGALVSIPYRNLSLAVGGGAAPLMIAVVAGGLLCTAALRWADHAARGLSVIARPIESFRNGLAWIASLFALGVAVRVGWMIAFDAPQSSDGATYFGLARGLLEHGRYLDPRGDLAYWPPGYVFWLYAHFLALGIHAWVPGFGNIVLYGITLVAVYRLGQAIATEPVARFAAMLVAFWPNLVFSSGLASKELLITALLPVALLLYVCSVGSASARRLPAALGAGATIGFATLAQPSIMLFPAVFLADLVIRRLRVGSGFVRLGAIVVAMAVVIGPWSARNFEGFGQLVPVATNGGDVFYRANNPLATGGYIAQGEVDLSQYGELERDRIGFQLGTEWIRENPGDFALLALKKQVLFLGEDAIGVYETLKRGLGINGSAYALLKGFNNLYWLALWVMILAGWRLHPALWRRPDTVLLQLAFLYFLGIDSVFESGGRHHVPVAAPLALLAAIAIAPRTGELPSAGGHGAGAPPCS